VPQSAVKQQQATATMTETLSTTAPSPTHRKDFPMSADAFFESYNIDPGVKGDWVPSAVLGYTDASEDYAAISNQTIGTTKWYIVSSKNKTIEVNAIEWVLDKDEPNGYRIDDPSPATKTYQIQDDTQIWLMIGSDALFRIPVSDLDSYIESEYGKTTLWNFTMVKDKITILSEQYVP